jgi:hypothetical protein
MIEKIKNFWRHSYESDRVAFYFELVSFVFTVGASLTLAITAAAPNMSIVYPGFFIGSVTAVYGYYRRQLAWPLMLTAYFAVVNVFGFGVAMGWW